MTFLVLIVLAVDRDLPAERPALELARARLEVGVDLLLQRLERRLVRVGQELVGERAGQHHERDVRVGSKPAAVNLNSASFSPLPVAGVVDHQDGDGPVLEGVGRLVLEGGESGRPRWPSNGLSRVVLLGLAADDQHGLALDVDARRSRRSGACGLRHGP